MGGPCGKEVMGFFKALWCPGCEVRGSHPEGLVNPFCQEEED